MIAKKSLDKEMVDFIAGETILIDKPFRWSSFKVVHEIRKRIPVKKVGHAGTLDPLATGLLILCTGKKTKQISTYQDLEKTYTGVITFGKKTLSMDAETEAVEEKSFDHITPDMIIEAASEQFTGEIMQKPPMYSAVSVKGKRLYKLARKGITVEREPRKVEVFEFTVNDIAMPDVSFTIRCSKGTYIRVIADDFGTALNSAAYLSSLRRTAIGTYRVEDALTMDEFHDFVVSTA